MGAFFQLALWVSKAIPRVSRVATGVFDLARIATKELVSSLRLCQRNRYNLVLKVATWETKKRMPAQHTRFGGPCRGTA